MTFGLYPEEVSNRISLLPGVNTPEPGVFDNFLSGAGRYAMQGAAKVGRAASMALSTAAIAEDAYYGTTTARDKHFKWHDDVMNRAVDYWTPKPHEVGAAGEIAGQLLSMIPQVIISPPLAIASTQLSTAEDLVRKGVDSTKAQAVGAVQGATLATGIWMPILGKTGFQRMVLGGAGFNAVQGVGSRGLSGAILEGTPAAKDFQAFDGTALTLDVLLGLAFGGIAHLSPRQRAQGEAAWTRMESWAKGLPPSDVDALLTLRQAQHLNVDSAPGRPVDLADIEAHTQRMRTAIDQLTQDRPVQVEDMPAPRLEIDEARQVDAEWRVRELQKEAARVAKDEGIDTTPIKPTPEPSVEVRQMGGDSLDLTHQQNNADLSVKAADPLASEAHRFATENPDFRMIVGKDADGKDVALTPKQYLDNARAESAAATDNVRLFEIAAACLMGVR